MSDFTRPLEVTPLDDGVTWRLTKPFDYHVGRLDSGFLVHVPAGFETNFASVPRGLWWLISPTGRHGKAAVVHDYLYSTHCYSKIIADAIFVEAMEVLGVSRWKRNAMWKAVRLLGKKAWCAGGSVIKDRVDDGT